MRCVNKIDVKSISIAHFKPGLLYRCVECGAPIYMHTFVYPLLTILTVKQPKYLRLIYLSLISSLTNTRYNVKKVYSRVEYLVNSIIGISD